MRGSSRGAHVALSAAERASVRRLVRERGKVEALRLLEDLPSRTLARALAGKRLRRLTWWAIIMCPELKP